MSAEPELPETPEEARKDDKPDSEPSLTATIRNWLRAGRRSRNGDASARETLEELIEERAHAELPIGDEERMLLANILELRMRTVEDAMVPRADIVAIDIETPLAELVEVLTREGHSRLPVYRETLDDTVGMVHIRDVLAWRGRDEDFRLAKIVRKALFVAPSMHVLELLIEMRVTRCHMALVVDEFGGIDGLVTIEDLVEEIVGEIDDEHDHDSEPELNRRPDGVIESDARALIEDLETLIGPFATAEERDDSDTLGGLVFSLAGRVPVRGEVIGHPSGIEFEIVDADPRTVRRLRVRDRRGAAVEAD